RSGRSNVFPKARDLPLSRMLDLPERTPLEKQWSAFKTAFKNVYNEQASSQEIGAILGVPDAAHGDICLQSVDPSYVFHALDVATGVVYTSDEARWPGPLCAFA